MTRQTGVQVLCAAFVAALVAAPGASWAQGRVQQHSVDRAVRATVDGWARLQPAGDTTPVQRYSAPPAAPTAFVLPVQWKGTLRVGHVRPSQLAAAEAFVALDSHTYRPDVVYSAPPQRGLAGVLVRTRRHLGLWTAVETAPGHRPSVLFGLELRF